MTKRKTWKVLNEPEDLEKNLPYGTLIPLDRFLELSRRNGFRMVDGYGYWSTGSRMDINKIIIPLYYTEDNLVIPDWATHVLWIET